jgi:hypothetical protein
MNRRIGLLAIALGLAAAACGQGAAPDTQAAAPSSTTGAPATTTTTEPPTTTSAGPATTTTASPTTTTTEPPSGELATLQLALSSSAEISSGRMEGAMEFIGMETPDGPIDLSMAFGGAFNDATESFSFYMDMSGLIEAMGDEEIPPELEGLFDEMEMRQIGDRAYLKFGFFTMLLGSETPWIAMPADEGGDTAGGFTGTSPGNPAELLGAFDEAGATVEDLGTETVNGVVATHYRAVFDMEALLEFATPEERAELEAMGPLPEDFMPMDIWVSADGLVVRFSMEIDGTGIEAPPGEGFERIIMRYDLFDWGADVVIEPPPADEVTNIEDIEDIFGFET